MKNNILLFQKIVPSYRVAVFRELYNRFGIITCHSRERKNGTWKSFYTEMDFKNELLPAFYYKNKDTALIQNVIRVLFKYRPKLIITEFSLSYITFWILFILKPVFGYKLAIWTHGIKNQEILKPFTTRRSKIALKVYRKVDAILLYSNNRKEIVNDFLNMPDKLFVAGNTLDVSSNIQAFKILNKTGKEAIRKELGFSEGKHIIFIGRLLKTKRIDTLLKSFEIISGKINSNLHIIGWGEEEYLIKFLKEKGLKINYYGKIFDKEIISRYLFASDIMLNPGYTGLNIIDGFCFGLPYITCFTTESGPFHSPEIEYLKDGINGLLCKPDVNDIAEKVAGLLSNDDKLMEMSVEAEKTVKFSATMDCMMTGFSGMINYLGFEDSDNKRALYS